MSYNKLIALLYLVIISGIGLLVYTAWLTWDKMDTSTTTTEELCQVRVPLIINGEPSKGYIVINFDPPVEFSENHRIYITFETIED